MARTKKRDGTWTEAKARDVLAACEASGLSMRAFALREDIRPRRLYWWAKRLGENAPAHVDAGAFRFVPAIVKPGRDDEGGRLSVPAVTIRVGATARLEIVEPEAVSAGWVAELLVELERIACS